MSDQQHKWYIVQTASNCEKRVRQSIIDNADRKNLSEMFADVIVPAVEFSKIRRGKEVKMDRKIMPGYVLVKMILNPTTWQLVKSIQQVNNFLGDSDKPSPVPEREVENILNQIKIHQDKTEVFQHYEIGETVKIIDGPFDTFNAVVDEVDEAKSRLRVSVSIFGRPTPIDLNFTQVQKIDRF
jgi:transcriptional antiterminator NusG